MQILRLEDPRDELSKASRFELCQLAKAHGIEEIKYGSQLQLPDMVRILSEKGVTSIKLPDRPLGIYKPVVLNAETVVDRPVAPAVAQKAPEIGNPAKMGMNELRAECKRRGIKMDRRDNMNTLRDKLGQNAA